jgi:hypothetical protein
MIRERMEALCRQVIEALEGPSLRGVTAGEMEARVAALAQERAQALLQGIA